MNRQANLEILCSAVASALNDSAPKFEASIRIAEGDRYELRVAMFPRVRLEYGGTEGGRLIFKREFDRGAICYAIVPFDELPTGEKLISEILEASERLRSPVGLSKDHQPPRQ